MCCLVTGSRRSALARIPTAKVTSSPRWCAGASPTASATRAVLLVHGFTDYFFNTELADHFAARGFAFYALDLHKCGRSWREGQTPHFTTDLARYDTELERATATLDRRRRLPAPTCSSTGTPPAG